MPTPTTDVVSENAGPRRTRRGPAVSVVIATVVYAVVLVALTLLKNHLSIGGFWDVEAHNQRSIDLELFNGFDNPPIWWGPWTNTFGNIALFFPFGFLLYHLLGSRTRWKILTVTAYGALTSLTVELLQFVFAVGYTDVDDLLFNTIGAFAGVLVASVVSKRFVTVCAWLIAVGSVLSLAALLL